MCGAGHFVHRMTFCAEGNESGSFSAQSVTLCTKCSPRRPHWFAGRAVSGLVSRGGLLWRGQGKGPGCGGGVGGGLSGSASLSGCLLVVSSCRGRGAGCLLPGSGGVQVVWGRGRRWEVVVLAGGVGPCCTFILGSWWGRWRGSNVFSPWGASGDRMNVQLGRRCTFILFPGPGLPGRSAWSRRLLIAVCKKNVQLRLTAARERRLSCHDLPVGAI